MKENFVEQALLAAGQDSQFVRQSENQQEIGHRKQQILLFFQPFLTFSLLTFRTMPVAAGVVLILDLVTLRTGIYMPTQGFRAAAFHIPHHLPVAGQHLVSIELAVLVSPLLKDISQFSHAKVFQDTVDSLHGRGLGLLGQMSVHKCAPWVNCVPDRIG